MKNPRMLAPVLILALAFPALSLAHVEVPVTGEPTVAPAQEYGSAQDLGMEGPTETKGIEEFEVLGTVALEKDFPALADRMLRARAFVLRPGAVVAVHRHEQRPGVAYIVEGELVEHRIEVQDPIVRRAGEASFEQDGTVHWWENVSDLPAKVVVVDLVHEDIK